MKKKIIAVVAAFGAFGALTASAATLGGLTSTSLGADQTVVASCDTDGIGLAYSNSYDAVTNAYRTTAVTLSGVNAACASKTFRLTLSDAAASLSETTGAVALTSGSQTITLASAVDSRSITRAALTITG